MALGRTRQHSLFRHHGGRNPGRSGPGRITGTRSPSMTSRERKRLSWSAWSWIANRRSIPDLNPWHVQDFMGPIDPQQALTVDCRPTRLSPTPATGRPLDGTPVDRGSSRDGRLAIQLRQFGGNCLLEPAGGLRRRALVIDRGHAGFASSRGRAGFSNERQRFALDGRPARRALDRWTVTLCMARVRGGRAAGPRGLSSEQSLYRPLEIVPGLAAAGPRRPACGS